MLVGGIIVLRSRRKNIMIMVANRLLIVVLFWYHRNKLISTGLLSLPRMHVPHYNKACPLNGRIYTYLSLHTCNRRLYYPF